MQQQLDCIIQEPPRPATACVIWLHGLGADGHDFSTLANELALPSDHSIRFVLPHAPIRPITLNGGMPMRGWFDIIGLNIDSPEDHDGIVQASQQCHLLIEQQQRDGISADQIILGGFSQGGAIALYSGLHYSKRLSGIVALSSYLPLAKQLEQSRNAANQQTPIFMAHGTQDPIVSVTFGQASCQQLITLGHEVTWHTYPMAHQLCMEEITQLRSWILARLSLI